MIATLFASALAISAIQTPISKKPDAVQTAAVCFKSGEQTSGMNKICYYDCMGSATAITISIASLCPLTINN